eukprot:CAMPEP_0171332108 /NCGR_PEP_ID=MMETSP0878-20121228/3161_1 /TAXON_ID=67004 /ORGANISM="Thalassiosira weissflogii, Strain CCMP1336" /LENGTH=617 /DNA_ID=CAMNT_0011832807 /DNA_START=38 /DNA_END=1891 /DNA_ORIENTATION=-
MSSKHKSKKNKKSSDSEKKKKKKSKKSKLRHDRCASDEAINCKENTDDPKPKETSSGNAVKSDAVQIQLSVNIAQKASSVQTPTVFTTPSSNSSNEPPPPSTGWSWGAAFAAASTIRPNDDDLDEDFLKRAAASSSSIANEDTAEGVWSVAQLAKEHDGNLTSKPEASENDRTENDNEDDEANMDDVSSKVEGRKRKRKSSAANSSEKLQRISSTQEKCNNQVEKNEEVENDNDDDVSTNSEDVSLEGRMITLPSNNEMAMVLINRQSNKVYSSGERKPNGHRLVIGKFADGEIEFDLDSLKCIQELEDGGNYSNPIRNVESMGDSSGKPSFPYPTNPDDHCETPLQAYQDILPILDELCRSLRCGKKDSLRIYDPYYCDGSVTKHLSTLGYNNIYNVKEDCYSVWKSKEDGTNNGGNYPQLDVFLTNPPYSEDHIEKLMSHITSPSFGNTPWLLLMPNWVHKKDYYVNAITTGNIHGDDGTSGKESTNNDTNKSRTHNAKHQNKKSPFNNCRCNPFYVVPMKRYVYLPPLDFRDKKASDVHKKSSPFVSMWYVWGGTEKRNEALIKAFKRSGVYRGGGGGNCDGIDGDRGGCDFARNRNALRELRRSGKKGKGGKK